MTDASSDLVAAYWRHHKLACSTSRRDRLAAGDQFWAWEEVEEAVDAGGPEAVDLIVALADAVDGDDAALGYLGAGPLENLLRSKPTPPEIVLDRLDTAVRENPSVRVAVASVWWGDDDDPELRRRFERFRE